MDKVLSFLKSELNDYLNLKIGESDKVWMGQLVDDNGDMQAPANAVVMTLVNVEEEKTMKSQRKKAIDENNGDLVFANPDIKLTMFILFAARFNHYEEALKFLTLVAGFFQARNVFNPHNSPALPPELKRIVVELFSIPLEQLNYLWGTLGAKYHPSLLYKVKLLTIQQTVIAGQVSPANETESNIRL